MYAAYTKTHGSTSVRCGKVVQPSLLFLIKYHLTGVHPCQQTVAEVAASSDNTAFCKLGKAAENRGYRSKYRPIICAMLAALDKAQAPMLSDD